MKVNEQGVTIANGIPLQTMIICKYGNVRAFSKKIGVSDSLLSHIIHGRRKVFPWMEKPILEALGITKEQFREMTGGCMNTEFETTRTKIIAWLDEIIKYRNILAGLADGSTNAVGTDLCGYDTLGIHIYRDLEKIAFYLGLTLTYDPNWNSNGNGRRGQISAWYKGVKLFQLWTVVR